MTTAMEYANELLDRLDREDNLFERAIIRDCLQGMADLNDEVREIVRAYGIPVE